MKDVRDRRDDDERENGTNGEDHKRMYCRYEKLEDKFGANTKSICSKNGLPYPSSR